MMTAYFTTVSIGRDGQLCAYEWTKLDRSYQYQQREKWPELMLKSDFILELL